MGKTLACGTMAIGLALATTAQGQVEYGDAGIRTIDASETVSVALKAFSRRDEMIVHGSERSILLDQAFTSIGPLLGGPDVVQAKWSEIRGFGENVIQIEIRSRDGGALVPSSLMIGESPAEFIGWEIGVSDPIEFLPFAGDVNVTQYKVFVSENRGIDFTVFDLTSSFRNPWDGTDVGRVLPLRTPGGPVNYNLMILEYTYEYTIPSPGGVALLGATWLLASRRRR